MLFLSLLRILPSRSRIITFYPNKNLKFFSTKRMAAKVPPAAVDVVVVAGGRRDTAGCVIVTTDYSTYLINCPEGAQRILTDIGGSKFSRLEHIFLTTNRWRNGGGLLGMALTLQTAGSKRLAIHGPPNSEKILTLARSFTTENDELKLQIEPLCSTEVKDFETMFSDDSITVGCVPLRPNYEVASGSESPKRSRQSPTFGETALAFIMKPKPKLRRVDMQKCIKLGLPRGPAVGQLVRGDPVTLPDGRVIKPDDVLDDPIPSRPVLFVDCPSTSYVKSLAENAVISALMPPSDDKTETAQLVVHMSPLEVFNSTAYQEWLGKFSTTSTDHLILNENCPHVAHERIYRMQAQLNLLDDVVFKLLDDQLPENLATGNKSPLDDEAFKAQTSGGRKVLGGAGLTYVCRANAFQASVKGFPIQIDNKEFCSEIMTPENKAFDESITQYRDRVKNIRPSADSKRSFPKVLFLGTASAVPGKRRNSSGILMFLQSNSKRPGNSIRHVLIDCAEGTTGQFLRYFGLGKSGDEALISLDIVLLSHRHADHHMGLLGIVNERHRAFQRLNVEYEPLVVVYPRYQIGNWLKAYSSALDPAVMGRLIKVVEAERLGDDDFVNEAYSSCCKEVGLSKVEPVPVRHCKNALGYVVTTESGFRLAYSGDTMPCDALVKTGFGCDLLIHEATFDDDLLEEAVAKRHSTTSQAIEIGQRMAAKMTLLTHFSQRYETLPHLSEDFFTVPPKHSVGIAFDNMLISVDDFPILPHMAPVLRHMFAEKLEQLDEIKQKRSLKRERESAKFASLVSSQK